MFAGLHPVGKRAVVHRIARELAVGIQRATAYSAMPPLKVARFSTSMSCFLAFDESVGSEDRAAPPCSHVFCEDQLHGGLRPINVGDSALRIDDGGHRPPDAHHLVEAGGMRWHGRASTDLRELIKNGAS